MQRKGLAALAAITVVVGLAAWGLRARSLPVADALPDRVFPGLSEQLNDLTALSVAGHDEHFTLRRTGEVWGLDEKDGHPVRFEKLKGLLVGLSELRPIERKTASPALHAKLGLQEPEAEGATSIELTACGADGMPVAALIVGNPGPAQHTRYVRKAGEDQTWLAQGELNPDSSLNQWIDTEVMRLESSTVSRVTVTHPDGEVLTVAKQAKDDPIWTIEGVPEEREPKQAGSASAVTGALQWLDFDDVAAASRQPLPEGERVTSVFETWDGLRVTVIAAREPAPAAAEPEPEAVPEADAETPTTPPEGANWVAISVAAGESASEEAREQAAKMNARLSPWVYKLGSYRASTLRQRMDDLTQPKPAEQAEEPEAPGAEDAAPAEPPDDSDH